MDNKTSGNGERIAIPSPRCKPSEDAGEQSKLQVATAIEYDGECTSQEDCDGYEWEQLEWEQLCSRDIKVFSKEATKSEVANYLDALWLTPKHRIEILDSLFN
jgi:hypothetical protein